MEARALGLADRWPDVANTYADVNRMFGDIVKVTPSSKVVGDMALAMVSAGLTRTDVEDPEKEVAFPDSVVGFFRGDLGQPPGGFPKALQAKVLKGAEARTQRPGDTLPPADLAAERTKVEAAVERDVDDEELASYQCVAIGETDEEGYVRVFFELNGAPRSARVPDRKATNITSEHPKADPNDPSHVPSPMPGTVGSVAVQAGHQVKAGDLLLVIEAMKMETAINAEQDGVVRNVIVSAGSQVDAKDLLLELDPA